MLVGRHVRAVLLVRGSSTARAAGTLRVFYLEDQAWRLIVVCYVVRLIVVCYVVRCSVFLYRTCNIVARALTTYQNCVSSCGCRQQQPAKGCLRG
jgi:hypothetical protein